MNMSFKFHPYVGYHPLSKEDVSFTESGEMGLDFSLLHVASWRQAAASPQYRVFLYSVYDSCGSVNLLS